MCTLINFAVVQGKNIYALTLQHTFQNEISRVPRGRNDSCGRFAADFGSRSPEEWN